MKLMSFIEENNELIPIEVEIEIWPGLPDIHFIGLADAHLKESSKRIKSAIRAQGFEFPIAQQVLVNLKPSYLRKSSRGVELAVAVGFLMATGQVSSVLPDRNTFFYGELSLRGEVQSPSGISWMKKPEQAVLICGLPASEKDRRCPFDRYILNQLQDINILHKISADDLDGEWSPPEKILDLKISKNLSEILAVLALGQHSALFAGASGAGKTTAAHILHALQPGPTAKEKKEILYQLQGESQQKYWRPFIQPHHKIPLHSLLGGGAEAYGGDISRSNLGVLLLDEFLEFQSSVIEALREPLEQKKLRVSRNTRVKEYPLQTQFIATTNLCPCGEFVPGQKLKTSCRFSLLKCRSYSGRFSGPLLDRFEVVVFLENDANKKDLVRVSDLRDQLQQVREQLEKNKVNLLTESIEQLKKNIDSFWFEQEMNNSQKSERRRIATLKLARSYSLWLGQREVNIKHLNWASPLTNLNFEKMRRWDS